MEAQQTKTDQEKKQPVQQGPSTGQAGWKRWLNYQSVVKQLPFILFLAVLAVIYIYNGHYADKTIRKINRTAKEVKELKYEYIAVKSKVMFQGKQSELAKSDAIKLLELKELTEAPAVLKDSVGVGRAE